MKKALVALLTGLLTFSAIPISANAAGTPSVAYCAHVQDIGWMGEVADGALAGTTGRSKRVEALKIHINGDSNLGVSYQAHVQDYGWMNPVADGAVAGTSGQSKRVEALRINLTGADAAYYDIYYCSHVQNYGWMNWVKNGAESGSAGLSYRVEGVEIRILPKGSAAPGKLGNNNAGYVTKGGSSSTPVATVPTLSCSAHVQNIGWMGAVSDGAIAGTTGRSLRVEALKIYKSGAAIGGSVNYKVHVQDIGWMNAVSDGAIAGTTGQSKRLEAIQISLTGDLANKYDVYYRTHVQDVGWTGWACNGNSSGSAGFGRRMEALQIKLVSKGSAAPGSTVNAFVEARHKSDGSLGFFKYVGANDAITVLNAKNNISGYTHMGASNDATSLDNMKKALDYIDECNNLRARHGLSALKVSDYMMAVSQVQCNASSSTMNHTRQYSVGENLAWGYRDPFDGWYTEEKSSYDAGERNYYRIGHYLNIIDSDYISTGFAMNQYGSGGVTHEQSFAGSYNSDRTLYTVAQYRARFMNYYNTCR